MQTGQRRVAARIVELFCLRLPIGHPVKITSAIQKVVMPVRRPEVIRKIMTPHFLPAKRKENPARTLKVKPEMAWVWSCVNRRGQVRR